MADISGTETPVVLSPELSYKVIFVETPATSDSGDTFTVPLTSKYGIKSLLFIMGVTHTTANSVVITEAPTTSVTNGVLTITLGGASNDQIRGYLIIGK